MESEVMMVSVQEYTLERAKEGNFYACPTSYNRDHGDYIAFYRGNPVGAVTHYAKIEEITEDDNILTGKDKLKMFPRLSTDTRVFKLGEIKELNIPVERKKTHSGVQGVWYTTLHRLKEAENLAELQDD